MAKKSDTKEFKEKIKNMVNVEYSLMGEYINSKTKVKIKHNKCGYEYEVTPHDFLGGNRCPKCAGKLNKNTEIFKQEVFDLVGDEFTVSGEYVNSQTKLKIKHNKCGYEYEVRPTRFLNGDRCPKCSGLMKKTTEQFKQEVFDLVGDEFTVSGEYVNSQTKLKIKHNKCGYEYEVKPDAFLRGNRCPRCSGLMKKTTEQFKQVVFDLVGEEYTVLGEYKRSSTKISMKHNKCGYEYQVKPNDFVQGIRCPRCNQAKGEEIIHNFLDMMGFKIEMQFRIEECNNVKPLPFDFAVFKDNVLLILIEYDGIQHFQPVSQFGGKEGFKTLRKNDEIKNKYCRNNQIHLIRIGYKDFENIENILEKKLKLNHNEVIKRRKEFNSLKQISTVTEDFIKKVKNLRGDEYTVLGEYIRSSTKIKMKHNKCAYEYEVTPNNFLRGARCPKCAGRIKKNTQIFKKEVFDLVGDEYTVLGEYVSSSKKIKMKHNICGYEYEVRPYSFISGIRCPQCADRIKKTTEQFKQEVFDLVGDEYTVLGKYANSGTKIKIEHNICGYEYEVNPNNFLRGARCPKCSGNIKKTTEIFKQEVFDLVGDEYTVLGKYANSGTKIKIEHNICGYEYEVNPNNFLRGNRCPKCSGLMKKTREQFKKEVFDLVGDEYTVLSVAMNMKLIRIIFLGVIDAQSVLVL